MYVSEKQIKSDARKAEILRLLADGPMALGDLRGKVMEFEPDLTSVNLRQTLYNMVWDGQLIKGAKSANEKNPTYILAEQKQDYIPLQLRGFAEPRRISADREENIEIMKSHPLRTWSHCYSGSSSLMSNYE